MNYQRRILLTEPMKQLVLVLYYIHVIHHKKFPTSNGFITISRLKSIGLSGHYYDSDKEFLNNLRQEYMGYVEKLWIDLKEDDVMFDDILKQMYNDDGVLELLFDNQQKEKNRKDSTYKTRTRRVKA